MDRLTLPLEVGKKYICRDGRVRTAGVIRGMAGESVVSLDDAYVYAKTGVVGGHSGHPFDAVADHVETAKGHPHAALMALYAQDAAETAEPWKRWEARLSPGDWRPMRGGNPLWLGDTQYRRKPKTIRIGEHDVPEPLRVAPEVGTQYWCPTIAWARHTTMPQRWADDDSDRRALSRGVAHLSQEAAEIHTRALLALTEQKS